MSDVPKDTSESKDSRQLSPKGISAVQGIDSTYRESGSFSNFDWSGYPENLPKPEGTYRILEGEEYEEARAAANKVNREIHKANPALKELEIHEIKPVKFGGSPTDLNNKIALTRDEHHQATTFWNRRLNELENE